MKALLLHRQPLEDVGGLMHCPDDLARGPMIERLVTAGGRRVLRMLKDLRDDREVRIRLASCKDVAARYHDLLDQGRR